MMLESIRGAGGESVVGINRELGKMKRTGRKETGNRCLNNNNNKKRRQREERNGWIKNERMRE